MKRTLVIALAVLALPLLGAPTIRNGSSEHFYQPVNWMSVVWAAISGFISPSGGPNPRD